MNKDYEIWTKTKAKTNEKEIRAKYKEREIWFANLGENIGFEEDGKGNEFIRPVLIIQGFSKELCLVVPLSTAKKTGKFYYPLTSGNKKAVAILSQLRSLDTLRLSRKMSYLNKESFIEIKEKLKELI